MASIATLVITRGYKMETRGGTRQPASFWAGCYENHQNGRVHHCTVGIFRGKNIKKTPELEGICANSG